jgi:adenosylhomocysteine nucleosidase
VGAQHPIIAVSGLAWEARIAAGPGVTAIAGGADAEGLTALLQREVTHGASGIISFGIAGGLVPSLKPGTWILGRAIVTPNARWRCDEEWTRFMSTRLPNACIAELAAVDRPASTPSAKHSLHEATGAIAVDTESHIAAWIAAAHGLPFVAFRVVADPVGRKLPSAATTALRREGTIDHAAVFRSVVRTPTEIPLLARTAFDARAALRALSRGRRLLGLRFSYPDSLELKLHVM